MTDFTKKAKQQNRPGQDPIINQLLNSDLFEKVGTSFRITTVRLIGTDIFVTPSGTLQKPNYQWFHIPKGSMPIDECRFFGGRPKDAVPSQNQARKILLKEVFEMIPFELQTNLMERLNIAPSNWKIK